MGTTTSADGTRIVFDTWGSGPPVVLVGGAFSRRGDAAELGAALAEQGLTGVGYDRRGRGDSGDTAPYAVEREVEDLAAVVATAAANGDAVDGPVFAYGKSSGGALLLLALAAGLPVSRAAVMEPPYRVAGAPPVPPRYVETLSELLAAGDRVGMIEYFHTRAVGMPLEALAPMRGTPVWDSLLSVAPTLIYDSEVLGGDDESLPVELLATIRIPVLSVTSTGTAAPWMGEAAEQVARTVPDGRFRRLEGAFHEVPAPVLAPALAEFYLVTRTKPGSPPL